MLTLLIAFLLSLQTAPVETVGTSYAQPGDTATFILEFTAPETLLFNRLGPPRLSLSGPFGEFPQEVVLAGTPWLEEPDIYFQKVDPVVLELEIPAATPAGIYQLAITGTIALCDKAAGICYKEPLETDAVLVVGETGENSPIVVNLVAETF